MPIEEFDKFVGDTHPITVTYTNADGVTQYEIAGVEVTVTDSEDVDVTATTTLPDDLSFEDNIARPWVTGGEVGQSYSIDVSATMTTGETLTKEITMNVVDN